MRHGLFSSSSPDKNFAAALERARRLASRESRRRAPAPPPRSSFTFDHGLMAFGIIAAVGSASFAGYMIQADTKPRLASDHLMLFGQPVRTRGEAAIAIARPIAPPAPDIDYTPVGSIPAGSIAAPPVQTPQEPQAGPSPAVPIGRIAAARPGGAPIRGYVLRGVRNGVAIVDGPSGSFLIELGMTLPNAGRVISVDRRGGQWVVTTSEGVIGERPL